MSQMRLAPGVPVDLGGDVTCVLAPNPSALTFWGTNSYIINGPSCIVIDPGPKDDAHLKALLTALDGRPVSHILVTHAHNDHSPLAAPLRAHTGADVYAFGDVRSGMSDVMRTLEANGHGQSSEGLDHDFAPDHCLKDGERLETPAGPIIAHHTPGHLGNHMCFSFGDTLFSGDHIMGWATSLVSPPYGDLTDFMASCQRLAHLPMQRYLCGHGAPIADPAGRLVDVIAHRQMREQQIIDALKHGPSDIQGLTAQIYHETPQSLWPAAARNVFAHLIDLTNRNILRTPDPLSFDAVFERV